MPVYLPTGTNVSSFKLPGASLGSFDGILVSADGQM